MEFLDPGFSPSHCDHLESESAVGRALPSSYHSASPIHIPLKENKKADPRYSCEIQGLSEFTFHTAIWEPNLKFVRMDMGIFLMLTQHNHSRESSR